MLGVNAQHKWLESLRPMLHASWFLSVEIPVIHSMPHCSDLTVMILKIFEVLLNIHVYIICEQFPA